MTDTIKTEAQAKMKDNMLYFWIITVVIGLASWIVENIPLLLGLDLYEETEILGLTFRTATIGGMIWNIVPGIVQSLGAVVLFHWILRIIRGETPSIEDAINFAVKHILTIVIVSVITSVVIGIGTLLLIIPGVIAALGLSQVTPIMIDHPELEFMDVIKKSWELMDGKKIDLFFFILSFIGWILLCLLIIPFIYVLPYLAFSMAIFYTRLIGNEEPKKEETKEEPAKEEKAEEKVEKKEETVEKKEEKVEDKKEEVKEEPKEESPKESN